MYNHGASLIRESQMMMYLYWLSNRTSSASMT